MDKLYEILIKRFNKELKRLNFGHDVQSADIQCLWDLTVSITCIKNGGLNNSEIRKLIEYYG